MKRQSPATAAAAADPRGCANSTSVDSTNTKKVKYNDIHKSKASTFSTVTYPPLKHHSIALQSILSMDTSTSCSIQKSSTSTSSIINSSNDLKINSIVNDFFEQTWQRHPKIYKNKEEEQPNDSTATTTTTTITTTTTAKDKNMNSNDNSNSYTCPLQQALSMGWDGIADMLEQSRNQFPSHDSSNDNNNNSNNNKQKQSQSFQPLILQNQTPIQIDQIKTQYSYNPFAAYLDGCSIIQNHANYFSTKLSNLCYDLQQTFPHVYCNTYLTPSNSMTVNAHADDRDVFVIQIKGRKRWKVYRDVPVEYPYGYEQVGKNGLPVPSYVTDVDTDTNTKNGGGDGKNGNNDNDSKLLIDTILEEGDILYMPRGYVHEASTIDTSANENDHTNSQSHSPSFHATIAIMTSDWSYSKVISEMTRTCLDEISNHRMAIPVNIRTSKLQEGDNDNTHGNKNNNQNETTREKMQMKLESIFSRMKKCITMESIALELEKKYEIHNQRSESIRKQILDDGDGNKDKDKDNHAHKFTNTGPNAAKIVTMSSRIRASTPKERESVVSGDRGLTVREDISDSLLSIIAHMKNDLESIFVVSELRSLIKQGHIHGQDGGGNGICDFTLCSFVKCCVDLGVISIVK